MLSPKSWVRELVMICRLRGLLFLLIRKLLPILSLMVFCLFVSPVFSQSSGERGRVPGDSSEGGHSLKWYDAETKRAIEKENYEYAIKLLREAIEKYPAVSRFCVRLGDLFYEKHLYKLALEQYKQAERRGDESYYTLSQISRSYGKLNRNKESIDYLIKITKIYPDTVEVYDDLGWMYFKTHQLRKGEKVLKDAIKKFGNNRALSMTLGTIYSGLYDYANAKKYYLRAIKDALKERDKYFASIAYYNLSLLEHNFYHFNSAFKYTEDSIRNADRAPGHLSKGELYLAQMNYRRAFAEYEAALARDTTPLSKINLAILYQKFGKLKLAIKYLEEVLYSKDLSWMFYYGTDLERHFKDIHEILADSYEGLARMERLKPVAGIVDRLKHWILYLKYRILGYYHRQKFRIYSVKVGKAYLKEKDFLDAYWEFYRANEAYKRIALKYLYLAREIETRITPHSAVYYMQEEGKVKHSVSLLKRTLGKFDPFWERDGIVDSLRLMIPLMRTKAQRAERRRYINKLYSLNRGALLQYGFGLPLEVGFRVVGQGMGKGMLGLLDRNARFEGYVLKMLRESGSDVATESGVDGFRYRLYVEIRGNESFLVRFIDNIRLKIIWEDNISVKRGDLKVKAADLVNRILDRIYLIR